jgi:hypothetical protein
VPLPPSRLPLFFSYLLAGSEIGLLLAGAQVVTIFFYSCPEASPVKLKMLHASSKGTMLQAVEGMGISVAKSLEGIEASELADGLLMAELYPSEGGSDATPTITKAAPRGGRKLNSRNKR